MKSRAICNRHNFWRNRSNKSDVKINIYSVTIIHSMMSLEYCIRTMWIPTDFLEIPLYPTNTTSNRIYPFTSEVKLCITKRKMKWASFNVSTRFKSKKACYVKQSKHSQQSVQWTYRILRHFRAFFWLRVFLCSQAESTPAQIVHPNMKN